jgi:hypothetical protein
LPLRAPIHHSASDALIAASLPAAPWDLSAAPSRRQASPKSKFKVYPIGYFHIDIAEVRTAQGGLHLIVAIDRTSKFAFVELHEKVTRKTAADFLRRLIAAVPTRSTRSSPTTGPTSPRQAIRELSRAGHQGGFLTPESPFGRTPSNTPAPRTTSTIG